MSELPTFAMRVTDLNRSIAFYRDAIGFTLVETRPEQDVAMMLDTDGDPTLFAGPGAGDLTALLAETHFILTPGESVGFHGGDLAARRADLLQRGVEDVRIDESRFGDQALRVKDPDGYTLEFIGLAERTPEQQLALYARMPDELDTALAGLSESDFELSKDADSWSIRYIVHHVCDGDLLFLDGMRAALAASGKQSARTFLGGNDVIPEHLDYAHRPVAPSIVLSRAVHDYVTTLGRLLPDAWERYTVRDEGRQVTFGQVVQFANQHSTEHIEEIYEIRRIHGK